MNARDSALIASLYLAEASNMRAFARRRLNDPHEADDLVNEAFRILSERNDLQEIRNPAAFLMTVLHRQINSHLRRSYRRKHTSIEEAETDIPPSPDAAEAFEQEERASLVEQSLNEIRSQRQKRALSLYSLNYKPGQIADMETAAGQPTTSHQVSCLLQGGLANLRNQFRRRGLIPSLIPWPWLVRLRSRVWPGREQMSAHLRLMHPAALQVVVVISVASIFKSTLPQPTPPQTTPTAPAAPAVDFTLAAAAVPFQAPSASVPNSMNEGASNADQKADNDDLPIAGPAPEDPAPMNPRLPIDSQPAPAPRAELSPDQNGPDATVELPPHQAHDLSNQFPEKKDEPAASLQDQAVDRLKDPDTIPTPQCGGLPPVCDDEPPPEYR